MDLDSDPDLPCAMCRNPMKFYRLKLNAVDGLKITMVKANGKSRISHITCHDCTVKVLDLLPFSVKLLFAGGHSSKPNMERRCCKYAHFSFPSSCQNKCDRLQYIYDQISSSTQTSPQTLRELALEINVIDSGYFSDGDHHKPLFKVCDMIDASYGAYLMNASELCDDPRAHKLGADARPAGCVICCKETVKPTSTLEFKGGYGMFTDETTIISLCDECCEKVTQMYPVDARAPK